MDDSVPPLDEDALATAIENYQTESLQSYLDSDGDPNACLGNERGTLLHKCVCVDFTEGVEILLLNGASPKIKNTAGVSPLHSAARSNDDRLLSILIEHESVEVRCDKGLTPVLYAAWAGSVVNLGLLLDAEATLYTEDIDGNTPLHYGIQSGCVEMVQFIIGCGVSPHAKNRLGVFPLHEAAAYGNEDLVYLLLDSGAGIDCRRRSGESALFIAVVRGHKKLAKHLVMQGAQVDLLSGAGWSPLFMAFWHQRWSVARMLFCRGAQVCGPYKDLLALLRALVLVGRADAVYIILESALSQLDLHTKYGALVLTDALHSGHDAVAVMLVHRGAPCNPVQVFEGNYAPLAFAIHKHANLATTMLLKHGAGVDRPESSHLDPYYLSVAIASRNFTAAVELIDNGTQIDERVYPEAPIAEILIQSYPPILCAVVSGAQGMVDLFFERGDLTLLPGGVATPLHYAASSQSTNIMLSLLAKGYSIDAKDSLQRTPLHWAVLNDKVQAASMLMLYGAEVDSLDKNGNTALLHAVDRGNARIVSTLLGRGADCHSYRSAVAEDGSIFWGLTLLCFASLRGYAKVVKLLLQYGADVNQMDKFGRSALDCASGKGFVKIMELLLSRGAAVTTSSLLMAVEGGQDKALEYLLRSLAADCSGSSCVLATTDESMQSLLQIAAGNGNIEIAKVLLSYGALINSACNNGEQSALCTAVSSGHQNMVRLALEHGAPIEARVLPPQASPIHIATKFGNIEALTTMLEWGWDVDSGDNGGSTPLMVASMFNESALILPLLIKRGAETSLRNLYQENAAHYAAWMGLQTNLQYMLQAGCPIDAQRIDGSTPLHFAAKMGWTATVANLSLLGADLDIPNIKGNTPLLWATEKGHRNVVATLLGRGAMVNIKNKVGYSALHIATMHGDIKIMRLLFRYGSDVNQEDRCGWTALNWALEALPRAFCSLTSKVVDLLLKQGSPIDCPGVNPLHYAVWSDSIELVCLLLNQGAIIDAMMVIFSPLQSACSSHSGSDITAVLLERGCDVGMEGSDGRTALHYSVLEHCTDFMKIVLKWGICIDEPGPDSLSSLCIAAVNGDVDVMSILIEEGASIRYVDESGRSALIHASQNGQEAGVRVLLAVDAGIGLDRAEEKSPLIIAASNGHEGVVGAILEAIDCSQYEYREREVKSAWHIAQRNEHEDVANILASYLKSRNVKEKYHGMYHDSENSFAHWNSSPGGVFIETILDEDNEAGTLQEDRGAALKLICW